MQALLPALEAFAAVALPVVQGGGEGEGAGEGGTSSDGGVGGSGGVEGGGAGSGRSVDSGVCPDNLEVGRTLTLTLT